MNTSFAFNSIIRALVSWKTAIPGEKTRFYQQSVNDKVAKIFEKLALKRMCLKVILDAYKQIGELRF